MYYTNHVFNISNHIHPCQSRWHRSHVITKLLELGRRDPHGPGEGAPGRCMEKTTLWQTSVAGWKTTIFNRRYIDSNGGFPIAMLVYLSVEFEAI